LKVVHILKGMSFFKIWPSGGSTPASLLLENHKKRWKNRSTFSRGCHFSKIWPAGGSTPASPLLENHKKKMRKSFNILKGMQFFKNLTRRRQHPCLPPAWKSQKTKKNERIVQHSQGDVIFQKSDPPEAAPLLAPCLKIAKKFGKSFNIPSSENSSTFSRGCHFSQIWPAGGSTPANPCSKITE